MSTWNYRLIRHDVDPDPRNHSLALHEVYYDDEGKPQYLTENPTTFVGDHEETLDDIASMLKRALQDVDRFEVLSEAQLLRDVRASAG